MSEQVVSQETKQTVKWLDKTKAAVDKLLKEVPEILRNEPAMIRGTLEDVARLTTALRSFSLFDTGILTGRISRVQMEVDQLDESGTKNKILNLKAPQFVAARLDAGSALNQEFHLNAEDEHNADNGFLSILGNSSYNYTQMFTDNKAEKEGKGVFDILPRLRVRQPALPMDVARRLEKVRDQFSTVYLAWEAEWEAPKLITQKADDPFVIGELFTNHGTAYFLIDQFDLSNAERRIVSEFTMKVED
jgi:hypothetical protein